MKKLFISIVFLLLVLFVKFYNINAIDISDSLVDGEVGVTIFDESTLIVHLKSKSIILKLNDTLMNNNLIKYDVYRMKEKPIIDDLNIDYNNSGFSFSYANYKFCVGFFFDCDFTYLYDKNDLSDADIYFYNSKTKYLLKDIAVPSYSVDSIISILWDEKNYMLLTY